MQVKCSWKRNMPKVNTVNTPTSFTDNSVWCLKFYIVYQHPVCSIPTSCIVAIKIAWACCARRIACIRMQSMKKMKRSVQVVAKGAVKSVHSCGRINLFLSFTCRLLICFSNSNNSYPVYLFWFHQHELSTASFFFLFFDFHCKKKKLVFMSLMTFVFGCVQKLPSKISFFVFSLRLTFSGLAHDCDQVERKCNQKSGACVRPEKFCDWHRKDFSSPGSYINKARQQWHP